MVVSLTVLTGYGESSAGLQRNAARAWGLVAPDVNTSEKLSATALMDGLSAERFTAL